MATMKKNQDGTIDVTHKISVNRVRLVEHLHEDAIAVVQAMEQDIMDRHTAHVYQDAAAAFKVSHAAGETGQPANPFDVDALIEWYFSWHGYETRPAKMAREKAEIAAAQLADKEVREAEQAVAASEAEAAVDELLEQ